MKGKRATIADIAKKSGVSKTSVSFAFNYPERIGKETREKILSIAKELNFSPDPVARNFSKGRHMAIGFLLPQKLENSLANPYTQEIIKGIGVICEKHGYTLTLIPPLNSSIPEAIKNATVDALIALGFFFDKKIDEAFKLRNLPALIIDGAIEDGMVSVAIDDVKASEFEMEKVLSCGHRDIAIITLPDDAYASLTPEGAKTICKRRKLGYQIALQKYGLSLNECLIESTGATLLDGKKLAQDILDNNTPTCFVCMSDIVAIGVINAIKERGLRVPDDISVVGFDGILDSSLIGIDLTTVVQSATEKGQLSAQLIFSMLEGNKVEKDNFIEYSFNEGSTLKKLEQ